MFRTLIAEIGNNHFGSIQRFKDLCYAAKESGATHVKSQAGVTSGSMPKEFYKMSDLGLDVYIDLIYWCESELNIPLFYSVFSDAYSKLYLHQKIQKVAASQFDSSNVQLYDGKDCLISLKNPEHSHLIKRAKVMWAGEYLDNDPDLSNIHRVLSFSTQNQCGYSDHSVGPFKCIEAITEYDADIIEKHFTLEKNIEFLGGVFRDTTHGATPYEFEKIASAL